MDNEDGEKQPLRHHGRAERPQARLAIHKTRHSPILSSISLLSMNCLIGCPRSWGPRKIVWSPSSEVDQAAERDSISVNVSSCFVKRKKPGNRSLPNFIFAQVTDAE